MKKLSLKKFRDIFPYLFFGVCTTLVNVASYWVRPSIKDEYFSQLGQELPPIIVVEKGRYYDADIQPFLQNHDYKKIWPENIESNNESAFVFYRENR